jgi:VWFA-related protein
LRTLADKTSQEQTNNSREGISEATGTTGQTARAMVRALGAASEYAISQGTMPAYSALLALVQQLGTLPGRKSLVYFSDAPPDDPRSRTFLERVTGAANQSGVSVYAFDVSGVGVWARNQSDRILTAADSNTTVLPATDTRSPMKPLRSGNLDQLETQERSLLAGPDPSGLRDLAVNTGGFYAENSNDLRKPAWRLLEDVNAYYEGTFVPAGHGDTGQVRAISVKTTRPALRIQARAAYVAHRSAAPTPDTFEAPLFELLSRTEAPSDLKFRAGLLRLGRDTDGRIEASVVVEVPLREMMFQDELESNIFSLHFTMMVVIRDGSGAIVQKFTGDVPYRAALDRKEAARNDVYRLAERFSAAPGEYLLETALIDRNSGKSGARRDRINIDPFGVGLWISDVVVVRGLEPVPSARVASEPLRYANGRLVPDLSRELDGSRENPLSVFFKVGGPQLSLEAPKVSLELRRDDRVIAVTELKTESDPSQGALPYLASITPSHLRSRQHNLRVIAERAGEKVMRSISFEVLGPPEPEVTGSVAGPNIPAADPLVEPPKVLERVELAANPQQPPSAEQQRILEGARQCALAFARTLPNFSCIESTLRETSSDDALWHRQDSFVELLEYLDGDERRATLEVDGHKSRRSRNETRGAASQGEYGAILRSIFGPEAIADFKWQEWSSLNSRTVAVFSYQIDISHSTYALRVGARTANVGAHGSVFIDPLTMMVHRLTMIADGIPKTFPYRESSITVDYEFAEIGGHEYALAFGAEVQIRRANGSCQRNQMTFRNYKRFGAKSWVTFTEH